MLRPYALLLLGTAAGLAACSDPAPPQHPATPQAQAGKAPDTVKVAPGAAASGSPEVPAASSAAAALDSNTPDASGTGVAQAGAAAPQARPAAGLADADAPPLVQAIDMAAMPGAKPPKGWTLKRVDPGLLRAEVLLDRAGFSPGVIDGRDGDNLRHAVAAYAQSKGLASDGGLNDAVWSALTADTAAAAQAYEITAEDEAGPFIGPAPKDYEALSKLPALAYGTPLEALAEMFHMDEGLLKALNPGADFAKAGTRIVVASPRMAPRDFQVARIEVDKADETVRAFDDMGKLVAFYPASVGSTERPAPSGSFTVKAVAPRPAYYYDPRRLTFAPEGAKGKLKIAPGPNNPVGATWIALSLPTYGIHGTPDPSAIGKRQSHGCVRLTNWDAVELGRAAKAALKAGVKVDFVGTEKKA